MNCERCESNKTAPREDNPNQPTNGRSSRNRTKHVQALDEQQIEHVGRTIISDQFYLINIQLNWSLMAYFR